MNAFRSSLEQKWDYPVFNSETNPDSALWLLLLRTKCIREFIYRAEVQIHKSFSF